MRCGELSFRSKRGYSRDFKFLRMTDASSTCLSALEPVMQILHELGKGDPLVVWPRLLSVILFTLLVFSLRSKECRDLPLSNLRFFKRNPELHEIDPEILNFRPKPPRYRVLETLPKARCEQKSLASCQSWS